MSDALRSAIERAIADPTSGSSLRLTYSRGHDLAGTTRVEIDGAGRYSVDSDDTRGRRRVHYEGTLDARDRLMVWEALIDPDVSGMPSSTRPLADDEVPVLVSIRAGDLSRELRVWDDDARRHPTFHSFELALLGLVATLSRGTILTTA